MKTLLLERTSSLDDRTLGRLYVLDENNCKIYSCYTMELPWLNNRKFKSCIPAGKYIIKKRWSPKHKHHLHIKNVPGRTWILIHPFNYIKETQGCVGPGSEFISDGDSYVLRYSRITLDEILILLPKETVIEIRNS
jgi:hypothetical protein